MAKRRRAEWHIRAYGRQREDIEVELLLQVVIMLGRQLAREAQANEKETSDDSAAREEEA